MRHALSLCLVFAVACGDGGGDAAAPDAGMAASVPYGAECATSADCAGGVCAHRGALGPFPGGYCVVEGCNPSLPCPDDGVCVGGQTGAGVCFAGCSSDADCRSDHRCDVELGVCFPPRTVPEGGTCDESAGAFCMEGTSCFIFDDAPVVCRRDCAPLDDNCDPGQSCTQVFEDGTRLCLPPPSVAQGEACNGIDTRCLDGLICVSPGTCQVPCDPEAPNCGDGERCFSLRGPTGEISGVCTSAEAQPRGGDCALAACEPDLICVRFEPTGDSRCQSVCNPDGDGSDCDGDCLRTDQGPGFCRPPGDVPPGGACDQGARRCVDGATCAEDGSGGPVGVCRQECNPCDDPLEACGPGLDCLESSRVSGLCVPPAGERQLGEACSDRDPCGVDMVCGSGFCLQRCQAQCENQCSEALRICTDLEQDLTFDVCLTPR